MKASKKEQPEAVEIIQSGQIVKVLFRENIEQIADTDGDTQYQYDEYPLEVRNRSDVNQYITDNMDALLDKAKTQEEQIFTEQVEQAIDKHIDQVARERGYGRIGISPSTACLGYAASANPFQEEAIAFSTWMASVWPVVWQIQEDIKMGIRGVPITTQIIAELPVMVWPS
jgi:hypothetical protein